MAETREKTREEIVADWVASEKARLRKERKGRRLSDEDVGVTINSLMDAMTIILIFLLMNYSVDPIKIEQGKDMKLPASSTEINPKQSAAVTVTKIGIVLNDTMVVQVQWPLKKTTTMPLMLPHCFEKVGCA